VASLGVVSHRFIFNEIEINTTLSNIPNCYINNNNNNNNNNNVPDKKDCRD